MKLKTNLLRIFILLAFLILPTGNAYAQEPGGGGDVFLIGQNYTLEKGDELGGSLVVIGGNVRIEEDAKVNGDMVIIGGNVNTSGESNGDIVVIGGNMTISNKVNGEIVAIGGQIQLTDTAVIDGNVTTVGGQLNRDPGAEISGTITNNAPPVAVPGVPGAPSPVVNYNYNPFWQAVTALMRALAVAAIAMLLTLFFQPQFERVGDAILRQPFMAGSFGLLTFIVGPLAILIMAVTILLIPIAFIAALLIPLAWLFGIIALGQEVGDRFTKAINQTWAPVLSTGFGTFLLMIIGGALGLIPCVGWLIPFVIALLGVGGVAMTWFGTRMVPGSQPQAQVVEVPPAS